MPSFFSDRATVARTELHDMQNSPQRPGVMVGCFCLDGGPILCGRCESVPALASAHAEGLARKAGQNPLPLSPGDMGELEWRSWGVAATIHRPDR